MAKKKTYSERTKKAAGKDIQADGRKNLAAYIILFLLAFVLYGNTIFHGYVLDDKMIITDNSYVQQGISGIPDILTNDTFKGFLGDKVNALPGGRYRPVSVITFAIEHSLFGSNAAMSHFFNVLLFALSVILLYKILNTLFRRYHTGPFYLSISFIAALLFLIHPVHTEVIANIKSRDEILALLFSLLSISFTIRYYTNKKSLNLIYSGILVFLAVLSKENAATFIIIIPLTIYFFLNRSFSSSLVSSVPPITGFILALIIRFAVISVGNAATQELLNNPFLYATLLEKYATIIYTLGYYIKLLFFPFPLTYDYYPYHIKLMEWTNIKVISSLLLYMIMFVYAIRYSKERKVISYCIWFYLVSLFIVSNIPFSVGTFLAERFVYTPSVAFCIAISYILTVVLKRHIQRPQYHNMLLYIIMVPVIILFSYLTIYRNSLWKDNFTLILHDVHISSNSALSNMAAADILVSRTKETSDTAAKNVYTRDAIKYLRKTLEIHPVHTGALKMIADAYGGEMKNYDSSIYFYEKLFDINPRTTDCAYNIGSMYLLKNNPDLNKCIYYLEKAIEYFPQNNKSYLNLGMAYLRKEELLKAASYLEKAYILNKESNKYLLPTIMNSYGNGGNITKALYYQNILKGE